MNPLLLTDSYKFTHHRQYPPKTTRLYSYLESRGGRFQETVFFGLQYVLKEYLSKPIMPADIVEARELCALHFGSREFFNEAGFEAILRRHGGYWPVSIKAVPEGAVVPVLNVLITVENTDPELPWVTNFLETLMVQVWYPTTVATLSWHMKRIILAALERSGDPALIDFKLHDFGCRGVSSMESAKIGGMAHLVNFKGTDTVPALAAAREYYGSSMAGFSIPAAEHSTVTSWGEHSERQAFENMLDQFPSGLVAVVSDSWNIYDACRNIWGGSLKDRVIARDGTVVIRPDSGTPHQIVVEVLDILGEKFGSTMNAKGFKVLDPHVRVIQGDGIDHDETQRILSEMMAHGWSADNVAFGMGGALLQKLHRDTQKFAFKCSSATIDGREVDVFKRPATASWKNSKAGRLKLVRDSSAPGGYRTLSSSLDPVEYPSATDELVEVFRDGRILLDHAFEDIRARAGWPALRNQTRADNLGS